MVLLVPLGTQTSIGEWAPSKCGLELWEEQGAQPLETATSCVEARLTSGVLQILQSLSLTGVGGAGPCAAWEEPQRADEEHEAEAPCTCAASVSTMPGSLSLR